ncbi:MAG TPA: S41 family peptidase [Chitinophaga sp.]|uniref:S41 family peptidase n=1 Tax=Chitinophaga sp. TaxID=1869181 RepID=UPI002D0185ED|nr:S41 family peptidase [Chitinophaga sp.]HVI43794.1 S41 family peptidase [Chitinophaga sp.]
MHKKILSLGAKIFIGGILGAGMLLGSCRKDNKGQNPVTPEPVAEDSLKYLMYQIMQVTYADGGRNNAAGLPTYYWYSLVKQRNPLDAQYPNADTLLSRMKADAPLDRYSFIDRDGALTNKLMNGVSEQAFEAASADYGFDYGIVAGAPGKVRLFVLYADKNSPSGQAGVQRGWEITSVNGNTSFDDTRASKLQIFNDIFNSKSVNLVFRKPDNSTTPPQTFSSSGTYAINPVLYDTVYNVNGKNVGYFVMYTFSSVVNSSGQTTATKTALDQVFNKFASKGISSLIVDFRYNGGGAVSTAEYLDNAIAPASASGKVMYKYIYNDKLMQNLEATKLQSTVNFSSSTGSMALDKIFFITSGSTASASELTLNNLKPYFLNNLQLVGQKTYGKPVGFIDFEIAMYVNSVKKHLADLYAINFETQNANGGGGYYTGIDVNVTATDYVNVPWGDPSDDNLKKIFSYLTTGSYSRAAPEGRTAVSTESNLRELIPGAKPMKEFNGMVEFRKERIKNL